MRHWGERLVAFRDNPNLAADNMIGPFTVSMFMTLTGPIPAAETAPKPDTNRCSYCGMMMTVADEDGVYCGHEPTCRRAETAPTERKP